MQSMRRYDLHPRIVLSEDDQRQIAEALQAVDIKGDRYPPHLQGRVGREAAARRS